MSGISKRVSGSWVSGDYGIMKTATDTLSLPATIYADGTAATIGLKGNTVQNGTPTPSAPVDVVGVGELETSGEHSGQYKIPISSASTTTPVYLGEVQTTRKVKKLVLTGEESDWRTSGDGAAQMFNHTIGLYADLQPYAKCNMFYQSNNAAGYNNSFDIVRSSGNGVIRFNNSGIASTTTAWKTYLQQQYAAGTPVTVWYVLAEPTTGIVNEPLQKIGDYADSISGISIPTTDGANALSIGTTVQPSEVTAAYHGWHVGTVHERESGSWD